MASLLTHRYQLSNDKPLSAPGISRTRSWDSGNSLCSSPQAPRAQWRTVPGTLPPQGLSTCSLALTHSQGPFALALPPPSALCSNAVLSIEPNIGSLHDKLLLTISLLLSWHLQLYCHYLGAGCLSPKPKCPLKSCLSSGLRTGTGINIPLGA